MSARSDLILYIEAVAQKYSVSTRVIFQWRDLREETEELKPRKGKTGPKLKLESYRSAILSVVESNPSITLEELKTKLELPGCVPTLWHAIQRWGIVLKKSRLPSSWQRPLRWLQSQQLTPLLRRRFNDPFSNSQSRSTPKSPPLTGLKQRGRFEHLFVARQNERLLVHSASSKQIRKLPFVTSAFHADAPCGEQRRDFLGFRFPFGWLNTPLLLPRQEWRRATDLQRLIAKRIEMRRTKKLNTNLAL